MTCYEILLDGCESPCGKLNVIETFISFGHFVAFLYHKYLLNFIEIRYQGCLTGRNPTLLKNYRPISLLSHIYILFSRVITNRLARRFDEFQPPEQAGFRGGYGTTNHIHTVWQIIQKSEEYNQPLRLAFVDYEKAFGSIETWAVLESLQRCQVDW